MVNQIATPAAPPRRMTTVAERNSMDERLLLVLIVIKGSEAWILSDETIGNGGVSDVVGVEEVYPAGTIWSLLATLIS